MSTNYLSPQTTSTWKQLFAFVTEKKNSVNFRILSHNHHKRWICILFAFSFSFSFLFLSLYGLPLNCTLSSLSLSFYGFHFVTLQRDLTSLLSILAYLLLPPPRNSFFFFFLSSVSTHSFILTLLLPPTFPLRDFLCIALVFLSRCSFLFTVFFFLLWAGNEIHWIWFTTASFTEWIENVQSPWQQQLLPKHQRICTTKVHQLPLRKILINTEMNTLG